MVNYVEYIIGTILTALAGGITYLVRTVLTNKEEIELLKSDILSRDKRRDEDRQLLIDLKNDLKSEMKEVKADLRAEMIETREDIEGIRSEITEIWKNR